MKRAIGRNGSLRTSGIPGLFSALLFFLTGIACLLVEPEHKYRSSYSQATGLRFSGKYEESALIYRRALVLAQKKDNRLEIAKCLRELGFVAWELGNVQEASAWLTEALAVGHEMKNLDITRSCKEPLKIIEFYLLGKEARAANDIRGSIEHFNQALAVSRNAGLKSFALKCLRQKGSTFWRTGSLVDYYECNKRAFEIARQINHRKEEGRCLNNLGAFFASTNEPYKALEYFMEAKGIAVE